MANKYPAEPGEILRLPLDDGDGYEIWVRMESGTIRCLGVWSGGRCVEGEWSPEEWHKILTATWQRSPQGLLPCCEKTLRTAFSTVKRMVARATPEGK